MDLDRPVGLATARNTANEEALRSIIADVHNILADHVSFLGMPIPAEKADPASGNAITDMMETANSCRMMARILGDQLHRL